MFGLSMSKEILLKSVVALAKGYFDKNPTKVIEISVNEVSSYINDNYKEFNASIINEDNDTKLILTPKLTPNDKK